MIPYLKQLWNRVMRDPSWPERAIRVTMVTLGAAILSGKLHFLADHVPVQWSDLTRHVLELLGFLSTGGALAIPAGELNSDTVEIRKNGTTNAAAKG